MLPVVVSPKFLQKIFDEIEKDTSTKFEVNLNEQKFTILNINKSVSFEISPYKKHCLINGLDDIDYLAALKEEIASFEKSNQIL